MNNRRDEEACFGEYIKRRALLRYNRDHGHHHLRNYQTEIITRLEQWYPNFPQLYGQFIRWKDAA